MVDWEYFRKVRKLKVPNWLASHGITNYEHFAKYLAISGINLPPESEVKHLFPEPAKPVILVMVQPLSVTEVPAQADALVTDLVSKRTVKRRRQVESDEQSEPTAD